LRRNIFLTGLSLRIILHADQLLNLFAIRIGGEGRVNRIPVKQTIKGDD